MKNKAKEKLNFVLKTAQDFKLRRRQMKKIFKAIGSALILSAISLLTPAQKTTAIVETNTGCLIGGSLNKTWIAPEKVFPTLKAGEQFNLFSLGVSGQTTIAPEITKDPPPCDDYYGYSTLAEIKGGIATNAGWNATPREPKEISATDLTYLKIVGDILRGKKFVNPKIKIDKAYRIDLEGDGSEEVVLAATNYASDISPYPSPGDYSFLLLRKIVNGKAQNILLESEFYPRKSQRVSGRYAISAIADLNGDGKMEIIMHGGYYEGSWAAVYEVSGAKTKDVLNCSCGV